MIFFFSAFKDYNRQWLDRSRNQEQRFCSVKEPFCSVKEPGICSSLKDTDPPLAEKAKRCSLKNMRHLTASGH